MRRRCRSGIDWWCAARPSFRSCWSLRRVHQAVEAYRSAPRDRSAPRLAPPTPAIEAGITVEASTASGELVLVATANEGATLLGNNAGAGGELTFDKVGDAVCATVDYRDDEKSITGTVGGAPTSVG
jgi:hypothetical protein